MGQALIANHTIRQIVIPRCIGTGVNGQPVITHLTINPGHVQPLDSDFWDGIKEKPQIAHLLSIGAISEVKEQFEEVPASDVQTNNPEIPSELQEGEIVQGTVFQQEPTSAKSKTRKVGEITVE